LTHKLSIKEYSGYKDIPRRLREPKDSYELLEHVDYMRGFYDGIFFQIEREHARRLAEIKRRSSK
jgi:hypothetical protein